MLIAELIAVKRFIRVVSPPLALVPPPESALECEREEGIVLGRLHIGVDDETVLNDAVKVRCNARDFDKSFDNRRVEKVICFTKGTIGDKKKELQP